MADPTTPQSPPDKSTVQKATGVMGVMRSVVRILIGIVAALLLVLGWLGYQYWQRKTKPEGSVLDVLGRKNYRQYTATVLAKADWQTYSNVIAKVGDKIVINVTGQWRIGPSYPLSGPDGLDVKPGLIDWRVTSSAHLGQLIGGVGVKPELIFAIKDGAEITAPSGGPLSFRINDTDIGNNTGHLELIIHIFEP